MHRPLWILAAVVVAIAAAGRASAQITNWDGTTGNWSDLTKWDNGVPNSNTAIAQLLSGGSPFTSTVNGSFTINQLNINNANATVRINTGNSLTLAGASPNIALTSGEIYLVGGLITGGTMTGGGQLRISSGTLHDVSAANLSIAMSAENNSFLRLSGTTSFTSASVSNQTGFRNVIEFNQSSTLDNLTLNVGDAGGLNVSGGVSATLGSNFVLNVVNTGYNAFLGSTEFGVTGTNNILNLGRVASTGGISNLLVNPTGTFTNGSGGIVEAVDGGLLNIAPAGTFTNAVGGILRATNGGRLGIGSGGDWTNAGTIEINNGTLNLNRSFELSDFGGTLVRTGGMINIQTTLTNDLGPLDIQATFKGDLRLNGGTIAGGTLTSSGAAKLRSPSGTLHNVSISGNFIDLTAENNSFLRLSGNSNFSAASVVNLSGFRNVVEFNQSSTLDNVQLNVGDAGGLSISGGVNATIGSNVFINVVNTGYNAFYGTTEFGVTGVNNVLHLGTASATGFPSNLLVNPNGTLTIGSGGVVAAVSGGLVTVAPAGAFANLGGGTVQAVNGGTLNVPIAVAFSNYNGGTFTLTDGTYRSLEAGSNLNFGTREFRNLAGNALVELGGNATFDAVTGKLTTIDANAGFIVSGGRNYVVSNPTGVFTNNGLVRATGSGSTFDLSGIVGANFTNWAGGTLVGGTWEAVNGGSIILGAGRTTDTIQSGTRVVVTGATATFSAIEGGVLSTLNGTLNIGGGKSLTVAAGGLTIGATGVLSGNGGTIVGAVEQFGVLDPGNSAGTITVNGNVQQKGTSQTNIEIGGTTPGTQHDVIIINGAISLGGLLDISLLQGFVPLVTDNFVILQAQSITGQWSNTPGGVYANDHFRMSVQYAPTFVALSGFAPVPEPGSLLLVATGMAAFGTLRRNRNRNSADSGALSAANGD